VEIVSKRRLLARVSKLCGWRKLAMDSSEFLLAVQKTASVSDLASVVRDGFNKRFEVLETIKTGNVKEIQVAKRTSEKQVSKVKNIGRQRLRVLGTVQVQSRGFWELFM